MNTITTSILSELFEIGSTVTNFGFPAWVIGYHNADGNTLVLEDSKGVRWLADPANCRKVIGRPYAHQAV